MVGFFAGSDHHQDMNIQYSHEGATSDHVLRAAVLTKFDAGVPTTERKRHQQVVHRVRRLPNCFRVQKRIDQYTSREGRGSEILWGTIHE